MFRLPVLDFDKLSFWLGFLAATLFWWLLQRGRPLLPVAREWLRQTYRAFQQRNLAGAEDYLRRETLRRAQRMHLAAPLFALDEIIIIPRLLAPPIPPAPETDSAPMVSIAAQVLPYLPDWPELTSPLGAPTLTPSEALARGAHIAIIGQPGSGKTVALAYLASQFSRWTPAAEGDAEPHPLPLLMHVLDLDTTLEDDTDPLQNLTRSVVRQASIIAQPQVARFLQTVFSARMSHLYKPVLLLDGLDELSPDELLNTNRFLRALLAKRPDLQTVVTASSDYLDGLTRCGFTPLGMASWSAPQRQEFLERWSSVWTNQFLPEIKKQAAGAEIDPTLMNYWMAGEIGSESPLEWTLKIWSAYAGDLNGSGAVHLYETFIGRALSINFRAPVNALARKMVVRNLGSMSFEEVDLILSGISTSEPLPPPPDENQESAEAGLPAPTAKKRKSRLGKEAIVSQGERIIDLLIAGGLMVEHGSQLRFIHPTITGYLARQEITSEEAAGLARQLEWSTAGQALRFMAACSLLTPWISELLRESIQPLQRGLLSAARWLADAPPAAEWRTFVLRTLATQIQNEAVPFGVRARFAAAFTISRDPSTPKLFRQLLTARSHAVRQLALMGCGALGLSSASADMLGLMADPNSGVRRTACLALTVLPGEHALNTTVEILMQADEDLRQVAAESLARRPVDGHTLLEEAVTVEDLLARRAAVFGLMLLREDWSRRILESVAVEDSQWIVRNAAGQALEVVQQTNPFVPRPLPPPSESPWLLAFASKLGMGILPDHPATDVLLSALKSGTPEEQAGALEYLRNEADEGIIGAIYHALYSDQVEVQEPALYALWWALLSGSKLPNPTQFGVGY